MTKYLFIVDEFVPFPSSEYGGIWNVIAENDDECFDLITDYDQEFNQKYYTELRENIINARKFELVKDFESCVVEAFRT
jgi:hypothetical protein